MPAHAAPLPPSHNLPSPTHTKDGASSDAKQTSSSSEQAPSSFFASSTTSSSITGEALTTVPEESSPLDATNHSDVLSPRATQIGPTVATLEAEIAGQADASGKPVFSEPDFGVGVGGGPGPVIAPPPVLARSPGSFSAEKLKEGEAISPTER